MKINYVHIFTLLLFLNFSCKPEQPHVIKKYNFNKDTNSSLLAPIDIIKYNNFKELINYIQTIYCYDSIPMVIIRDKQKIEKRIIPSGFCFEKEEYGLYMMRNHISINDNVISKGNDDFPLDSLSYIMRKDYINFGKDSFYSSHPNKVVIEISYLKKSISTLPSILEQITSIYDELKIDSPLRINLKELVIAPPPPSSIP